MDTRFWGPSGWSLLHLITYAPDQNPKMVCKFFHTLAYVLPCKYCRYSFSQYMMEDPIENSCDSSDHLQKWLWKVHNKVNKKVGKKTPDPPFSEVTKIYKEKLGQGCSKTHFEGWDFLFSVAETHPLSKAGRGSLPIHDAPPLEELTTPLLRNKWNVIEPEERLRYYNEFWACLPHVLPFTEWRELWKPDIDTSSRKETMASLWRIRSTMEKELELLNKTNYNSLCEVLRTYRSGCGASSRSKTCRKKRR